MNKKNHLYYGIVFLLISQVVYADGLFDVIEKATQKILKPTENIFGSIIDEKQKLLRELQQEREQLIATERDRNTRSKMLFEDIKGQLIRIQEQLKKKQQDDYIKQKAALLNEMYQVLKDIQRARQKKLTVINDFITLLTGYLQDPDFAAYQKEHKLHDRLYYSFEDLHKLYDLMIEQEKRITQLNEQEKSIHAELENRKQSTAAILDAYKKRKESLESSVTGKKNTVGIYDPKQLLDLINLEERLFTYKKSLDELQVSELEHTLSMYGMQSFMAKTQLSLLKEYINRTKSFIRVSQADVVYAQEELSKKKQQYYALREEYRQELEKLALIQKSKEREVTIFSRRSGITLGAELDDWTKEPKQTVDSYVALTGLAMLNTQLRTLNKKQELLEAQLVLEDEKFKYESLQVQVKASYHKLTGQKFISTEEVTQEIKKYESPKAEAKASLARYREKINLIADVLSTQKKVIDHITQLKEDIQRQKDTLFRDRVPAYAQALDALVRAEDSVKEQIDILGKLTGIYSGITSNINNILQLIAFVRNELETLSKWHLQRPEYAISWQGVKNIIPDTLTFLNDISSYIAQFNITALFGKVKNGLRQPLQFILFIIKSVCILIFLLLLWRYLPFLASSAREMSNYYMGLLSVFFLLIFVVLSFVYRHFYTIGTWIGIWMFLQLNRIPDPYIYIFFYLFSIPYLLYITYRFIRYILYFNMHNSYLLLASAYQRRFIWVFSGLMYATIVIVCFRHAFMLINYYSSELPTILLAVNFIIFQIALILLITKEQILNLISTKTDFWHFIHEQVNAYYYLILLLVIAIIIMSNPYVGFGTLVLYALFAFMYTALLIVGLIWLHGIFKRIVSHIFFSTDDDIVRERFDNAKTWFGLLIMVSFLLALSVGIIITAKIWGWHITFADIKTVFSEPLAGAGTKHPITTIALFKIVLFIFGGFIVSYCLTRFVLDKVFDLLLVDAGVQHTVTSISQYLVVLIAIFFGFQSVGLGEQVGYVIAALTLSIGWLLKEPLSDFIAYFIILMQRPVKIGDYVKLDEETFGVVRTITARNTILRRKNSTTIIVPNASLINKPIANWNYTRNFIAFDDILIAIDFREDPAYVKELLLRTVEAHPNILKNPRPIVRLDEFKEYGLLFMVRGFLSSVYTLEQWEIASSIRIALMKVLREHNIKIAVPVRIYCEDNTLHATKIYEEGADKTPKV